LTEIGLVAGFAGFAVAISLTSWSAKRVYRKFGDIQKPTSIPVGDGALP
jgi:hypothetical protein